MNLNSPNSYFTFNIWIYHTGWIKTLTIRLKGKSDFYFYLSLNHFNLNKGKLFLQLWHVFFTQSCTIFALQAGKKVIIKYKKSNSANIQAKIKYLTLSGALKGKTSTIIIIIIKIRLKNHWRYQVFIIIEI